MLKSLKNIKNTKFLGIVVLIWVRHSTMKCITIIRWDNLKKTARIKYARSFIIKSLTLKTIDIKYKIEKQSFW